MNWRHLPARQRAMLITAAAGILILAIVGIVGLIIPQLGKTANESAPSSQAQSQESTEEDGASASGDGDAEEEDAVGDGFSFKTDKNGMAVMPVTTDPREAAAGAAAVAFSIDFDSLSRDEFFDEAIARMTHPAPEYVGPEGEITTYVKSAPFSDPEFFSMDPADVLAQQVEGWALADNPERYPWWRLAGGQSYDILATLPDNYWLAHTEEVLSEEQVEQLDLSVVPKFYKGMDLTPDTPGATLTQWWVLSDVENSMVGGTGVSTSHPAYFSIWCDAPEDGGLCGVAFTLNTNFPATWPRP